MNSKAFIHVDRIKKNLGKNLSTEEVKLPNDLIVAAMQKLVGADLMVGNIPFVKIVSVEGAGDYVLFNLVIHDDRTSHFHPITPPV